MYCTNCGKKIPDGSNFCPECGAKLNVSSSNPSFRTPEVNETNREPIGTTAASIINFSKWAIVGAVVLMLIGLALPVGNVSVFGMSEPYHISDFAASDLTDDRMAIVFLALTIIMAVITLVCQFLPKSKKSGNFAAIGTFVLALIYYSVVNNELKDYDAVASIGSGTTLILIGSIILLVSGILGLALTNKQ